MNEEHDGRWWAVSLLVNTLVWIGVIMFIVACVTWVLSETNRPRLSRDGRVSPGVAGSASSAGQGSAPRQEGTNEAH